MKIPKFEAQTEWNIPTEFPDLKQVSGTHYMYMKIQPAEFINKNKLQFAEGNAIEYICRHAAKGQAADIEKAIHYLEMILERDYEDTKV